MDKKVIESYYRYANEELDINKQEKFDNINNEKELNLKLFDLIEHINTKFDCRDLYGKVKVHNIPYSLLSIRIYFNNKLKLCEKREKNIDYSLFVAFLATGISILVTMAFKALEINVIYFLFDVILILFISGVLYYATSRLKQGLLNKIRIQCTFYELVLNILNEKINN
ncbi:hypothetical protein [Clostridium sp. JN-1]|uniref:hypothetical protein n=1 Tax=Clostridium sp. JN-1 TaxID=2483110 RepID=UPI000F0B92A0|nr:hypothetical protein [Clostridium sp. JN-1]